jgi:hypothetical protein
MEFSVTEANASLISHRSMSSGERPIFSSASLAALAGVRARYGKVVGHLPLSEDRRQRGSVVGPGPLVGGEHHGAAAVVDAGTVAGRVRALLGEDRRQLGERLQARLTPRRLVDLDHRVALLSLHGDSDDLLGQAALVGGRDGPLMGAQRPAIHIGPGHLQLSRDLRGLQGHVLAAEGVGEPVVDHRVDGLAVAHAIAKARVLEQVGGV